MIQRKRFAGGALQGQRDLDMTAGNLFLEKPAKLHLQGIAARGQTEMQIEETMVHGLQGKREREPLRRSRRCGAFAIMAQFPSDLGKASHRAYGHIGPGCHVSATALVKSDLANCSS